MIRRLTLIFAVFALGLITAQAQNFGFDKLNTDTAHAHPDVFQKATYADFHSDNDTGTYRWVRVNKNLSNGITSAICDNNTCYGPDDDSAQFFMEAMDTFSMICYFYPAGNCGQNDIELKVYKVNDPGAGEAYVTYHSYMWCVAASVTEVKAKELKVGPSPANDFIHVNYGSANAKNIRIVDVLGNVIFEKSTTKVSTRVDVSRWSKGLYFVTVQDGSTTINKSFVKK